MSDDVDRAAFEAWIVAPPYERSIARWSDVMTLAWPAGPCGGLGHETRWRR